jgi:hypothetical protein
MLHLRRMVPGPGEGPGDEEDPARDDDTVGERPLVCRSCGAPITSTDDALEVRGSHEHTFFNPAGYRFEIGCFRRAPGCVELGAPTAEFTWFPGFEWCFSACGACGTHLGWRYSSGIGDAFWGLIRNRLQEPS